jgi:hypothetical protein
MIAVQYNGVSIKIGEPKDVVWCTQGRLAWWSKVPPDTAGLGLAEEHKLNLPGQRSCLRLFM